MGYNLKPKIRIPLPELGDDLWVDIRHPKLLPAQAFRGLQSAVRVKAGPDGKPIIDESGDAEMEVDVMQAVDIAKELIVGWNLPDLDDESKTMRLPSEGGDVPFFVALPVFDQVSDLLGDTTAPKS